MLRHILLIYVNNSVFKMAFSIGYNIQLISWQENFKSYNIVYVLWNFNKSHSMNVSCMSNVANMYSCLSCLQTLRLSLVLGEFEGKSKGKK